MKSATEGTAVSALTTEVAGYDLAAATGRAKLLSIGRASLEREAYAHFRDAIMRYAATEDASLLTKLHAVANHFNKQQPQIKDAAEKDTPVVVREEETTERSGSTLESLPKMGQSRPKPEFGREAAENSVSPNNVAVSPPPAQTEVKASASKEREVISRSKQAALKETPTEATTSIKTPEQEIIEYKSRIEALKHKVTSEIGNPASILNHDNDLGRRYMRALLEAQKVLRASEVDVELPQAMKRLEEAAAHLLGETSMTDEIPKATLPEESAEKHEEIPPPQEEPRPEPATESVDTFSGKIDETPIKLGSAPPLPKEPVESAPQPPPAPITPPEAEKQKEETPPAISEIREEIPEEPKVATEESAPAPLEDVAPKEGVESDPNMYVRGETETAGEVFLAIGKEAGLFEDLPGVIKKEAIVNEYVKSLATDVERLKAKTYNKDEVISDLLDIRDRSASKKDAPSHIPITSAEKKQETTVSADEEVASIPLHIKTNPTPPPPSFSEQEEEAAVTEESSTPVSPQVPVEEIKTTPTAEPTDVGSKAITSGLGQLLSEWDIFKSSGLLGTGPSGNEHPDYLKIAYLPMSSVLSGNYEGADPKVTEQINEYVRGWTKEQGIIHTSGETFEEYLRRIIQAILRKAAKAQSTG